MKKVTMEEIMAVINLKAGGLNIDKRLRELGAKSTKFGWSNLESKASFEVEAHLGGDIKLVDYEEFELATLSKKKDWKTHVMNVIEEMVGEIEDELKVRNRP